MVTSFNADALEASIKYTYKLNEAWLEFVHPVFFVLPIISHFLQISHNLKGIAVTRLAVHNLFRNAFLSTDVCFLV